MSSGIAHLTVDDALVRGLIGEMAPLVQEITGWPLAIETMGSRVLPKNRGYEEIILGRLLGLGLDAREIGLQGIGARLLEYLVEENVLAAYQPQPGEILVIRENVDDSNLDGLRLILAHELVHRGQHLHHAALYARIDQAARRALVGLARGEADLQTLRRALDEIQPIMSLFESHAAVIQQSLAQSRYPGARIEAHSNLATALARLLGAQKMSQYTERAVEVSQAMRAGRLDLLYRRLHEPQAQGG